MLQIKLGKRRTVDPASTADGRSEVGTYRPGMSQREAWEAGRAAWRLKASNVLSQEHARIVGPAETGYEVLAVARITGVTRDPTTAARLVVEGELIEDHPEVGHPSPVPHVSENSIRYT